MALRKNSHQSQTEKKYIILISQRAWSTKELNPTMLLLSSQNNIQLHFKTSLVTSSKKQTALALYQQNNSFLGGI
jgi:hypothetical protein